VLFLATVQHVTEKMAQDASFKSTAFAVRARDRLSVVKVEHKQIESPHFF
jgi:hypothetical protein